MDREQSLRALVEHYERPRHREVMTDADVVMPGGSPECGGSVTVYLKGSGEEFSDLSWTGEGDIISQGAASILAERVHEDELTMQQVLDLDYEEFVDEVGREVVGRRTRNATLALSTLKTAVRRYQQEHLAASGEEAVCGAG